MIDRDTLQISGSISASGSGTAIATANNTSRTSFCDVSTPIVAMKQLLAIVSMPAPPSAGSTAPAPTDSGVTIDYFEPPTLKHVRSVAVAGPRRSADGESAGGLYAAGGNENGQYGDGTHITAHASVNIKFFHDKSTLRCVAMSNGCSVFVVESGEVYVVGANHRGQLGSGTQQPIPNLTLVCVHL